MEDSIYKRAGEPLELPIRCCGCSLLHKIKSASPRSRIPRPLLLMLSLPTVDPVSVAQISKLLITKPLNATPFSPPVNPVPVSQISSIHALYATDNLLELRTNHSFYSEHRAPLILHSCLRATFAPSIERLILSFMPPSHFCSDIHVSSHFYSEHRAPYLVIHVSEPLLLRYSCFESLLLRASSLSFSHSCMRATSAPSIESLIWLFVSSLLALKRDDADQDIYKRLLFLSLVVVVLIDRSITYTSTQFVFIEY